MQEIGIGVVGWGFMGRTHTHVLRELGLFYEKAPFRPVLKCVCTRREEAARQAMRDGGFERCTTNYSELLAMEDIQVVSICTPTACTGTWRCRRCNGQACVCKPSHGRGGSPGHPAGGSRQRPLLRSCTTTFLPSTSGPGADPGGSTGRSCPSASITCTPAPSIRQTRAGR